MLAFSTQHSNNTISELAEPPEITMFPADVSVGLCFSGPSFCYVLRVLVPRSSGYKSLAHLAPVAQSLANIFI